MTGNFYRPHPLMIDSGTFWRCKHGTTGLDADFNVIGCADCRQDFLRDYGDERRERGRRKEDRRELPGDDGTGDGE